MENYIDNVNVNSIKGTEYCYIVQAYSDVSYFDCNVEFHTLEKALEMYRNIQKMYPKHCVELLQQAKTYKVLESSLSI